MINKNQDILENLGFDDIPGFPPGRIEGLHKRRMPAEQARPEIRHPQATPMFRAQQARGYLGCATEG